MSNMKDPAQYLISSLNVRSHKAYFKPEVYGTISGDAFKSSGATLKDGGMNWGSKQEEKKAEQKVFEEKKGSKQTEVKQKDDKPKSEPEKVEEDKPTSKVSSTHVSRGDLMCSHLRRKTPPNLPKRRSLRKLQL